MNELYAKCIEETGRELLLNNQDIVKYLCSIEEERNTLNEIVQKQYEERKKIESEIERMTYKLCLINKSLSMRIKAKNNYDKTISEIKGRYEQLVITSTSLKQTVVQTQQELDDIMNKRIGTGTGANGEEIKMLYVKSKEKTDGECPCVYLAEEPTKDTPRPPVREPSPPPRIVVIEPEPEPEPEPPPIQEEEVLPMEQKPESLSREQSEVEMESIAPSKDHSQSTYMTLPSSLRSELPTNGSDNSAMTLNEPKQITSANEVKAMSSVSFGRISVTEILGGVDKPGGSLPDVNLLNIKDPSTTLLLARLNKDLKENSKLGVA